MIDLSCQRRLVSRLMIFFGTVLLSGYSFAALPPMSDSQREMRATHIVEGEVLSVESTVVDQGTNGRFQNRVFTAKIRVHKFVRAELFSEQEAETIEVKFWRPAKRPRGWAGPQGQNSILWRGEEVRLYLTRDSNQAGVYHLLMPNGWERLEDASDGCEEEMPENLK